MSKEPLPYILRRDLDGDYICCFPTLPANPNGEHFTVYSQIGQHSAASKAWYKGCTVAATEDEAEAAESLMAEVRGIYEGLHTDSPDAVTLKPYRKFTAAFDRERLQNARVK